jgi:hypothetical protein
VDRFTALVEEAEAASAAGRDFDWLAGRATQDRPSWGYQRLLRERLAGALVALDVQTGGGEVLAGVGAASFRGRAAAFTDAGGWASRP